MDFSCAFATSSNTPAHVELAETLHYKRAWLYDSPALYPDVWMVLTRCAERTSRIGLGPGVLVPSLRHPIVNAAAIAELVSQAPGRVTVAIGSGFTGRNALGQRAMPWRQVAEYVRCLKALLAGEAAEWEGAKIRMLQLPGFGAPRPIEVPILIGADGPKGLAVAAELGDGVFSAAVPQPDAAKAADWRALLCFGTVLDEAEDLTSPRVTDAARPAAAVLYHAVYERGGGAAAVDALPGGQGWREKIEAYPEDERHFAIHQGHLVKANPCDEPHVADLIPFASSMALTGTAEQLTEKIAGLAAQGVTEIVYQPAGSDIERELTAFASAAGLGS
ncbi:LLM class flavin-dependent oxidoreductase [Mycobacterium montefiorense]|uniref:5,10-methylenetetrahydromethanopterin reductase n=1 Tax=Mycobacterium montefiorense TaxID=154654 RepID=A0AA37PND9_9MYCO|nr:LLM class flavin-dependent oxidoreductase [Mycobacterium montefiorense]GBG36834.1 5,10-methylenetetrahydromethanopterin reductase [Mycobacterium montefiorense]GKU37740.1 5,10-methylenetetrahydromethanopterin reductase [Mycobacterium montefiorense]GKU42699.1 5,10-methylenetetrahydromethanopterin reductase [Mycobacterium montefiorense]GKU46426.1 5,10-methylenetetrahydromethanopterin reductase [Mycobacterium montefiorense]GKU50991.1 5,10-methylenetetrahydromethanopterin reductase [Mycobacteriu